MKYSKEYEQLLQDPSFPEEWKASAIEYRKLKKLIKDVVGEMQDMGLNREVMQRLLQGEGQGKGSPSGTGSGTPDEESDPFESPGTGNEDFEFEYDSDDEDLNNSPRSRAQAQRILSVKSPRRFRVRLMSQDEHGDGRPNMGEFDNEGSSSVPRDSHLSSSPAGERLLSRSWGDESSKHLHRITSSAAEIKAEYVFAGPGERPIPQVRLSLPERHARSPSPSRQPSTSSALEPSPLDDIPTRLTASQKAHLEGESEESEDEDVATLRGVRDSLPSSPTLGKVSHAQSPIWAITSGADGAGFERLAHDLENLDIGSPELEEPEPTSTDTETAIPEISTSEIQQKEILITLPSDVAFFELLSRALTSLSALHDEQQAKFTAAVQDLCKLISASIIPDSGHKLRGSSFTRKLPGKKKREVSDAVPAAAASYTKSDLYAWREIFTLWIEAQIFESNSERDRGERSVDEAERRLKAFAAEVVKRGLGDRRTLNRKESRDAWAEFLRLNVLLLDLKRFQVANISAARKILKKHDKRTALTATSGFASFVRATLDANVASTKKSGVWTAYNTSLPHILLSSLTSTLLPILPSLEDYTCLICTSIAFKPIRLRCSHLFCVRCLAKMQRAGKSECPLCRAKVVLLADKHSLDTELMDYMIEWFPLEVKEKQRSNEKEVAKQTAEDMGYGHDPKCVIM